MRQFKCNEELMDHLKFKGAQRRVVNLLMQGLSNEEIGEELYLATKSVKFQVTVIYKMTGLDSRARLMAGLVKIGWRTDNNVKLPKVTIKYPDVPTLSAGFTPD